MAKATDPSAVHVVTESFGVEIDGVPVTFRKGEPIQPEHPALKRWPQNFGLLEFPHPLPGKRQTFAEKMAAAKAARKAATSTGPEITDAIAAPEVRGE
jgi:hypothetical protein